jgi:hypothetical protein
MVNLDYFNRHVKLILSFYNSKYDLIPYRKITYEHFLPKSNVRIAFEIDEYASKGVDISGTANFQIYNLSEDINNLLINETLVKRLELQVGYGKETKRIYYGVINTAYFSYNNNDIITYLWCFNYSSDLLNVTEGKNLPIKNQLSYSAILAQMVKKYPGLKVDATRLDGQAKIDYNAKFIKNKTYQGLKHLLDCMSNDLGLDYYLDKDTVYLASFKEYKRPEITLSPQNGLLGNPKVTDSGLIVKSILNPNIRIFTPLAIKSDFADFSGSQYYFTDALLRRNVPEYKYKNFYNSSSVVYSNHKGDTHTNLWETNATTITLDAEAKDAIRSL